VIPRRHTNDLFEIFPDLPRLRPRTSQEQILRVRRQADATRRRATLNIDRQRAATERVRTALSARRRRR
jgi:hypothetical protein